MRGCRAAASRESRTTRRRAAVPPHPPRPDALVTPGERDIALYSCTGVARPHDSCRAGAG